MVMDDRRETISTATEIIEQATSVSLGEARSTHPMVLSCGGCFIPRPRLLDPKDPLYRIVNTPNSVAPAKIVSACASKGVLDIVHGKNCLN